VPLSTPRSPDSTSDPRVTCAESADPIGTPPTRGRHTAPHKSQRLASEALVFVDVIAIMPNGLCTDIGRANSCDTGTDWLVGPTSRTSRTSIPHAGCKVWHRFYTITGLSSQQRVTLVDTARLKRPLLIKVGI
jgi:hypothetical protein